MRIQAFNADYAPTLYRWYHDQRLHHYFRGFIRGASFEQCAAAPELLRANILIGLEDDIPVGLVSLADTDVVLRSYKLGLLTDLDHQHKGYGRDLLEGGLKWAFQTMNAHKVTLEILETDSRTIRGGERCGFMPEGKRRSSCYLDGKFYDEVVLSMLQSEYKERYYGRTETTTARNG